jgi:hypothetical protein
MKFKPSELKELIEASYNKKNKDINNFIIDSSLSNIRVKVYTVNESNDVIVTHRGSDDARDWVDNATWLRFDQLTNSKTYKMHLKRHLKAVKKYGAENIIVMGHSRGGLYATQLYKDKLAKQLVTYNKPVNLYDIGRDIVTKSKKDKNATTIRTSNDLVSIGNTLLKDKNKVIIPSDTFNPLREHGSERLGDLDDDKLIGKGIFKTVIDFSKIRKNDLKVFIKKNKKRLNLEVNITGLTKKQLISIAQTILDNTD